MFWNASRQEKRAQATEFPSSDSIGQRGEGMLGFHWSKFKTDRRLLYGLKRFQTERFIHISANLTHSIQTCST